MPSYTYEQVARHESPNDLWMVVYNKVYDVSNFVQDHPGGAEVLFDCGGIDATEAFEDVAHLDDAVKMLAPYFVGHLAVKDCQSYGIDRRTGGVAANGVGSTGKPRKGIRSDEKRRKRSKRTSKGLPFYRFNVTMIVLIVFACFGMLSYLFLQKIKWTYHLH